MVSYVKVSTVIERAENVVNGIRCQGKCCHGKIVMESNTCYGYVVMVRLFMVCIVVASMFTLEILVACFLIVVKTFKHQ